MAENKGFTKKINDWLDKTFSPNGKRLFIVLLILTVISVTYFSVVLFQNQKANTDLQVNALNVEIEKNISENLDDVDLDEIEISSQEDTFVNLTVDETGRANPFLPDYEASVPTINTNYNGYTLMAPPDQVTSDSEASQVVKTKVSGILYDQIRPSAILNISGSDFLVRSGDYINGYKVLSITKDLVTVQLGKNIYKAHVGEIMNNSQISQNTVYDLEHRFGGAKRYEE